MKYFFSFLRVVIVLISSSVGQQDSSSSGSTDHCVSSRDDQEMHIEAPFRVNVVGAGICG